SSSSAHWSSLVHALAGLQAPPSQVALGPHSLSAAHALHLPAWHTLPGGHCLSFWHSGARTHALAMHALPLGQSPSSTHSTHLPPAQCCPFLQSLSALQAGVFDESPQLAAMVHTPRASQAARTAPRRAEYERSMVWKLNSFGTLVKSAAC